MALMGKVILVRLNFPDKIFFPISSMISFPILLDFLTIFLSEQIFPPHLCPVPSLISSSFVRKLNKSKNLLKISFIVNFLISFFFSSLFHHFFISYIFFVCLKEREMINKKIIVFSFSNKHEINAAPRFSPIPHSKKNLKYQKFLAFSMISSPPHELYPT